MNLATAKAAVAVWVVSAAVIACVGALTAVSGCAGAVREALEFSFPERDSWTDVGTVLWRNGALATAALAFARSPMTGRLMLRVLATAWALNVSLAGAALGAYGERLIRHAAVYGILELAGFSVVLAVCLRLRRDHGGVRGGELFAACALLVMAAVVETIAAWRL